jgi:N-[(2S)-2-amino-2-carboxyethyl]-L-glutamate dehydrogenase
VADFNDHSDDLLVLRGEEVRSLLSGRELEIIELMKSAYVAHGEGRSALPHSVFLRFPGEQQSRIIALPAYLGLADGIAGLKWVSSFPQNLAHGLDRASAVVILNSPETGRPQVLLEGSLISAKRTAASAALAAKYLQTDKNINCLGFIGCSLINFEILRFLMTLFPHVQHLIVFDIVPSQARKFQLRCQSLYEDLHVKVAEESQTVLREALLISLATTALEPHIFDLSPCLPGSTILHVSLRDLSAEAILACDNVVDDIDHVCRAQTSIHRAEQLVGHRDFIRCTLADVLTGKTSARRHDESIAVFSPFGLGILDIALAKFITDAGRQQGKGTLIPSFLPGPWVSEERS